MRIVDLGTMPYSVALRIQHETRERRIAGEIEDTLLSVEHAPVYTRGRRSEAGELPFPDEWYADRGIRVVDVERGGKITYHGPGQIVLYPIFKVADIGGFVAGLEQAMVSVLRENGLEARGRSGEGIEYTGAWIEDRKVGQIGLHISHGVTMHGLSLNVSCDLEPFSWIVPCGLSTPVTSIAQELGDDAELDDAAIRRRLCELVASR